MKTKPALLEDEFIDMKFITRLTGLSDKWFYKLIQEGVFPKPIKMGRASRWLKATWRSGCRLKLMIPEIKYFGLCLSNSMPFLLLNFK